MGEGIDQRNQTCSCHMSARDGSKLHDAYVSVKLEYCIQHETLFYNRWFLVPRMFSVDGWSHGSRVSRVPPTAPGDIALTSFVFLSPFAFSSSSSSLTHNTKSNRINTMERPKDDKDILIIGGGIAGLSAGIYARKNGYSATILEMGQRPGRSNTP